MSFLETAHGSLPLPVFLPDATRAVVKALDSRDLERCGIQGVVVNTLHLSNNPSVSVLHALGGVHRFMAWNRPVTSDSGGFQVYSMISSSPKSGSVTRDGFSYRPGTGHGKKTLTPEKCIQKQFSIGSDIMFCLDYCTHPDAPRETQETSVDQTIAWARRCKEEFLKRLEQTPPAGQRPLLFAVVQGGADEALRTRCAESLLEIGFDGYGYGGWPIQESGGLVDAVEMVARLIPRSYPKHALGIGNPGNVAAAYRMGYDIFDCALPTRDARNRRLLVLDGELPGPGYDGRPFYRYLYIGDDSFVRDPRPVDSTCSAECCRDYSRAYLHHLFHIDDHLAFRLATIHNLSFYTRLMKHLGEHSGLRGGL